MSLAQAYLPQLFVMVALSFAVTLWILITRLDDLLIKRKPLSYYEDWDGTGASAAVMRPTRQLANLFEFPVLFYSVVVLIVSLAVKDTWLPSLCWCFVVLRCLHAIIHIAFNRLWMRTPIFMVSQLFLLGIWVRFGLAVLG